MVLGAMSLPFVHAPTGARSALTMDALPTLLLVLPVFALTLIPDRARPLPQVLGWAALVLGLAALPYAAVKLIDASIVAETLDGSVGVGAYMLLLGALVTVAGIAVGLIRSALGLPSGGNPAISKRSPRRGGAPNRASAAGEEESPFGGPLFDDLEFPVVDSDSEAAPDDNESLLVFDFGSTPKSSDTEEGKRADDSGR